MLPIMDDHQLSLPRMADIVEIAMRRAGISQRVMDHFIQLPKYSSVMSDLSSKDRCVFLQECHSLSVAVGSTLFPNDGYTIFMELLETKVADGPFTTSVVKSVKSAFSASIEHHVLKTLLSNWLPPGKVSKLLASTRKHGDAPEELQKDGRNYEMPCQDLPQSISSMETGEH